MFQALGLKSRKLYMKGRTSAEVFRLLKEAFSKKEGKSELYLEPLFLTKVTCSVCKNEKLKPEHNYCGICGTEIKKDQQDGNPS